MNYWFKYFDDRVLGEMKEGMGNFGWFFGAALLILLIGPSVLPGQGGYRRAIDDPLGLQKAAVYDVYGEFAVRGTKLHRPSLVKMLNTGVRRLSGLDDAKAAWREFIHDDDVVALVFTWVGGHDLGTNRGLAGSLIECLVGVGFKKENLMIVGLDNLPDEAAGTRPFKYGWRREKSSFGADSDYLAGWLDEVTAIIDVPSIMDDNVINLRCCLANLSLPLLKSPAKLYDYMMENPGDPFIPEVS